MINYRYKDLTGIKFGRLIVKKYVFTRNRKAYFLCICSCGKEVICRGTSLSYGHINSCGCLRKENVGYNIIHGLSNHPLYKTWLGMKARCDCINLPKYKNYGNRGIKICKEWKEFINFYNDMISTWKKGLTIERVDVNKGYFKENCKWIEMKEQQYNKTNTHWVLINGEKISLSKAVKKYGQVNYKTTWKRLNDGWDINKALFIPNK